MADVEAAAAPGGGAAAADPSAAVSDAELSARLRVVLQAADLSSTTERAIRKSLEEELGVSLNERKAFIRAQARLPAPLPARPTGAYRPHCRWRRFCWRRRRGRPRGRRKITRRKGASSGRRSAAGCGIASAPRREVCGVAA
jgi:hypothetical protein